MAKFEEFTTYNILYPGEEEYKRKINVDQIIEVEKIVEKGKKIIVKSKDNIYRIKLSNGEWFDTITDVYKLLGINNGSSENSKTETINGVTIIRGDKTIAKKSRTRKNKR